MMAHNAMRLLLPRSDGGCIADFQTCAAESDVVTEAPESHDDRCAACGGDQGGLARADVRREWSLPLCVRSGAGSLQGSVPAMQ